MTVKTYGGGTNEPCLIHSSCNFCDTAADCDSHKKVIDTNATSLQLVNRYNAHLEYFCGLGMEFKTGGSTKTSHSMACGWDGQWSPSASLSECTCEHS